jgi:hypothetical protein
VDNPRWQPQVERYGVNGIPQLELFDAAGQPVGRSIGARRPPELEALTNALVAGQPLPALAGVGATSSLSPGGDTANASAASSSGSAASSPAAAVAPPGSGRSPSPIGPRSHG